MTSDRLIDGRLKIRHLVLVTNIGEHGTVVRAAEAMRVTQPVVTRGLHEVEDILGVPLFERGPRGMTPTVYGQSFLEHARAVISQLRQAEHQIELIATAHLGTVTVGTHLAGSNVLLPNAIAALKRERPRLTVVVREATPDILEQELLGGDIDLTVGRLKAEPPRGLAQERLYFEPIRLVARANHPAHLISDPALQDLREYPWILPVRQTVLRAELEQVFVDEGVTLPDNRIECTSILALRHLLLNTDSIAALPMLIAQEDDNLELIDTTLRSIRRAVGVTIPSERAPTPATRGLIAFLRQAARELDPEGASVTAPGKQS